MKPQSVKCPRCNGSGKLTIAELLPSLQEVLNVMKESPKRPWTAGEIHARLRPKCGVTAINNRLAKLMEFGFASRRIEGVKRLYTLNK